MVHAVHQSEVQVDDRRVLHPEEVDHLGELVVGHRQHLLELGSGNVVLVPVGELGRGRAPPPCSLVVAVAVAGELAAQDRVEEPDVGAGQVHGQLPRRAAPGLGLPVLVAVGNRLDDLGRGHPLVLQLGADDVGRRARFLRCHGASLHPPVPERPVPSAVHVRVSFRYLSRCG